MQGKGRRRNRQGGTLRKLRKGREEGLRGLILTYGTLREAQDNSTLAEAALRSPCVGHVPVLSAHTSALEPGPHPTSQGPVPFPWLAPGPG